MISNLKIPRLCILTTSFPRTAEDDSGIFIERLVNGLAQLGAKGIVLVPDAGQLPRTVAGAFTIIPIKYGIFSPGQLAFGAGIVPNLRRNPGLIFQIPGLILSLAWAAYQRRHSYDVIHAHWLASGVSAFIATRFSRKPFVVTIRGSDAALLTSKWTKWIFQFVLRRAAFVTSVNKTFLKLLAEDLGLPADQLRFTPNGVDLKPVSEATLNSFAAAHGLPRNTRCISFVGRIVALKRVELIIRALQNPILDGIELLLAGRTDDADYVTSLQALAKTLGVDRRVHFLGSIAPLEIAAVYGLSSAYVSASSSEGRPNSALEALSLGLPLVLSDIPGHRECAELGSGVAFFSAESETALADVLDQTLRAAKIASTSRPNQVLSWIQAAEQYATLLPHGAPRS